MKSYLNALLSPSDDSEFVCLVNTLEKFFPPWKMKALLGEDPDYAEELGYDIAKTRAKVQSYDKAIKVMEARRKKQYERLQNTCSHPYVAETRGKPDASYSHEKYDVRVCEVCGLYEYGPGATYNLYSNLSDANLGRVMMRRIDRDELKKIEKLTEGITT